MNMNRIELEIPVTHCSNCGTVNELYSYRPYGNEIKGPCEYWRVEHRCPKCDRRVPVKVRFTT